jgi:branched-chain amino acid transport system substrate-binding protein
MTEKTKIIIAIAIVFLIVVLAVVLLTNRQATSGFAVVQKQEAFKVGIIAPLTGELSSLGENVRNGALLSYDDLAEEKQGKVNILFEDDHFDAKTTVSAFNKLVQIDNVNSIVCFASGPCNAVAPLAEEYKIPLIAIASDPKIPINKSFVVRLEIAPSEEAKILAQFIDRQNYSRIASVVALQDGIKAGYAELMTHQEYYLKEVFSENVNTKEKDFRTIIAKIIEKDPDVIFLGLLPGQAGEFGKQARELGYSGSFVGLNFIEGEETLTAANGTLEGLAYTNAANPTDWFSKEYELRYNKSIGPGSAHLYDSIGIISKCISEGKSSNDEMASCLNSIKNYSGAFGTFNSTGSHELTLPVALRMIKNNSFVGYS